MGSTTHWKREVYLTRLPCYCSTVESYLMKGTIDPPHTRRVSLSLSLSLSPSLFLSFVFFIECVQFAEGLKALATFLRRNLLSQFHFLCVKSVSSIFSQNAASPSFWRFNEKFSLRCPSKSSIINEKGPQRYAMMCLM